MAWIESHQTLAGHPKTRKLAHLLNISKPAAIGHLHCFWWWALDYADDGDLNEFDDLDIAIGAEWDGHADMFVEAMVAVGFIDDDHEGRRVHDWEDYAGKLVQRRKANARRMREARAVDSAAQEGDKPERAKNVQRTQRARVELQDQTRPDQTGPDQTGPYIGDANASSRPKPKPQKRATQIPRDFRVDESLLSWGREHDFTAEQMESQLPRFIDHWAAKGEARKDWNASFRTWMRNAKDWGHLASSPDGSMRIVKGGKPTTFDRNQEALANVAREFGYDDDAPTANPIDTTYRRTS